MLNPTKADSITRHKEKNAASAVYRGTRKRRAIERRYVGIGAQDTHGYPAFLFEVNGNGELPKSQELTAVYVRSDESVAATRVYCSLTPGRLAQATEATNTKRPPQFTEVADAVVLEGLKKRLKGSDPVLQSVRDAQDTYLLKHKPPGYRKLRVRLLWFNRLVHGPTIDDNLPLASIGLNLGLGEKTWGHVRKHVKMNDSTDYTDQVEGPEPTRRGGARYTRTADACARANADNSLREIEIGNVLTLRRRRRTTTTPPAASPSVAAANPNPPRPPSPPPERKAAQPSKVLLRLDGRDFERQYNELRQTAVLLADIAAASSRHRPSAADHLFIHARYPGKYGGMIVGVSRALRDVALYNDHGTGRVWKREPKRLTNDEGKRQVVFANGLVADSLMTCLTGGSRAAKSSGTTTTGMEI